jgi:hypothetical protein
MSLQDKSAHMKHDKRFILIIFVHGGGDIRDKGFFALRLSDNHIFYACQKKETHVLGVTYRIRI